MISNTCAAVAHPEDPSGSVSLEPAPWNSHGNLLTWHRGFHYQWRITFPALCVLFLKEREEEQTVQTTCREKPSIYSQPKIAANNLMYHPLAANSLSVTGSGAEYDCYTQRKVFSSFSLPSFPL